jgi:uncharacterized protein GlcG (DUF336 family)
MHPLSFILFDSEGGGKIEERVRWLLSAKGGKTTMISLEQSNRIIETIFARGRELGCRPLSVVVVEPGAKVKAFQKEDGSAMMRFEMAYGKAYAALALGRSSSLVRVRTEERPLFMQYLIRASDDQIFPEGGGMLIRDKDGEVIGAVGVTGDTQERDEELAAHGIHAAGLKTDEDCKNLGSKVRLEN